MYKNFSLIGVSLVVCFLHFAVEAQTNDSEIIVSDNTLVNEHAYSNGVAELDGRNFVTTWEKVTDGHSDGIRAVFYDPLGNVTQDLLLNDADSCINDTGEDNWHSVTQAYNPESETVAFAWIGGVCVRGPNFDPEYVDRGRVYFRIFDKNRQPITFVKRIDSPEQDFMTQVHLAPLADGGYALTWGVDTDLDPDTFSAKMHSYVQVITETGAEQIDMDPIQVAHQPLDLGEYLVPQDIVAKESSYAVFTVNTVGTRIYGFEHDRDTHNLLNYFNFSLPGLVGWASGENVDAAVLSDETIMLVMRLLGAVGTSNLYGVVLGNDLQAIGPAFPIGNADATFEHSVTALNNGEFLVAWSDSSRREIIAQKYNSQGVSVGNELVLHQYPTSQSEFDVSPNLDVIGRNAGGYIMGWTDVAADPFLAKAKLFYDEVVIDNDSANAVAQGGWILIAYEIDFLIPMPGAQWGTNNNGGSYVGSDYQTADASKPVSFTWELNLGTPGTYQVYASIPDLAIGSATSNAVYEISHSAGRSSISVDQNTSGEVLIGEFNFDAGQNYSIRLSGASGALGVLYADSIRVSNK